MHHSQRFLLFILGIIFVFGSRGVSAETTTTITVCVSGCNLDNLSVAIDQFANEGSTYDTISILSDIESPGVIYVNSEPLTILGNNHTISKGNDNWGTFLRLENATVSIENLTFQGGDARSNDGGAMEVLDESTLTLENVSFESNQAHSGGAIYIEDSSVTINNSLFNSNVATGNSGNGFGGYGGAIDSLASSLIITNSEFRLNTAPQDGGAIRFQVFASPVNARLLVSGTTFFDNDASGDGGGIYYFTNTSVPISISNNLFNLNSASIGGGLNGTKLSHDDNIIKNNTFAYNYATQSGGGLAITWASTLENNTIVRNNATLSGANLFLGSFRDIKTRNNIIAYPLSGNNCSSGDLDVTYDNAATIYPNLDDDGSCDGFTIEADPKLYLLESNGGPTQTMRPASDSPIINAGNRDGTSVANDQRGVSRNNLIVDLGAYERVTQGDCQAVNQLVPAGSTSAGLTNAISAPGSLSGDVVAVEATVRLTTGFLGHVSASVKSPSNVQRTLFDRPGYPETALGCFTPTLDGVFNSDGSYPTLNSTCPGLGTGAPISGRFEPISNFSSWKGSPTEGNWSLNVKDAIFSSPTTLTEWCVSIEYFPDSATLTPTAVGIQASQVDQSQPLSAVLYFALVALILFTLYVRRRT